MLARLPDWQERFNAFVTSNAGRAFKWGAWDCALMVAGAVEAQTGEDFGAAFRGRYRTAAGAARALRLHGAGTLEATLGEALGGQVPLSLAHRGDICSFEGACGLLFPDHGLFVGRAADDPDLMMGPGGALICGQGWVRVPRQMLAPLAWSVPFASAG